MAPIRQSPATRRARWPCCRPSGARRRGRWRGLLSRSVQWGLRV